MVHTFWQTHDFEHKFMVCKPLLHPVILGSDFAKDVKVGIDWNIPGQLYLHQDHNPLPYSRPNSAKDSAIYSADCNEARLICGTSLLLPFKQ